MSTLNHKKCVRISDSEQEIIDKVRKKLKLSSDGEAIRFILNIWWASLGSDAVDIDKLSQIFKDKLSQMLVDADEI